MREMYEHAVKHNRIDWQAVTLQNLGFVADFRRRFNEALEYAQASLDLETDQRYVEGAIHNVGAIYFALGNIDQARQHFERARDYYPTTRNVVWRASHLGWLGDCEFIVGDTMGAARYYREALDLRRNVSSASVVKSLRDLARCKKRQNELRMPKRT